mgnify:CR=1 FL=1
MKIPVLSYHSISDDNSKLSLSVKDFEQQMFYLKKLNYETTTFSDIDNKKKKIIITFDDGYKDVLVNALPILKKFNFNATCFLVTNSLGSFNRWDKNKMNYKNKEIMNLEEVKEWIDSGMFIGSHTHNHLDLTTLSNEDIINELRISKTFIKNKFDINVDVFCYPYGKVNLSVFNLTKKFYKNAVTTNRARYDTNIHNALLIPRIDMGKKISYFKLCLKLKTIYEDIKFNHNELYM